MLNLVVSMYVFFLTERSVVCSSIIWFSANRLWQLVWFQHQCGFPIFYYNYHFKIGVNYSAVEAGCLLSGSIIENWLLLRKSSLLTRHMFRVSLSDAQFYLVCPTCLCFFVCFPLKYIQYQLFLCSSICHLSENGFDYKTNRFVSSSSRVLELCFLVVFCH